MTAKDPIITNLIILARRLNHVHKRLNNTFILDNGQFLTREDRQKLQDIQFHISLDITTVNIIASHVGLVIDIQKPLPGEPGSDPIADKYRSQRSLKSEQVNG